MSAGARSESSKLGGHDQLSEQKSPALASYSLSMSNQVDTSEEKTAAAQWKAEKGQLNHQKGKMDAGVVFFSGVATL